MPAPPADWIHLKAFAFPCVLGVYAWEQQRPQTLSLEASLNLDLEGAAHGDLAATVNYAETLADLQFIAQSGRWRLLESMAAAMARHLLAPPLPGEGRAQVERVVLRLAKPDVFDGRAVPAIEVDRHRTWCEGTLVPRSCAPGLSAAVLQVTPETGAYRLSLAPGAQWPLPEGLSIRVLAGAAHADAVLQPAGSVVAGDGAILDNRGDAPCHLLAVARPPLPCLP